MFENLKDFAGMMGQAKQLQEKAEQLKDELANRTVEADAGAGAVRVVMNGRFELVRVRFDRAMLTTLMGEGDAADHAMVEELTASAVNAAVAKAQGVIRDELAKLTGGMKIPGLEKMLGG